MAIENVSSNIHYHPCGCIDAEYKNELSTRVAYAAGAALGVLTATAMIVTGALVPGVIVGTASIYFLFEALKEKRWAVHDCGKHYGEQYGGQPMPNWKFRPWYCPSTLAFTARSASMLNRASYSRSYRAVPRASEAASVVQPRVPVAVSSQPRVIPRSQQTVVPPVATAASKHVHFNSQPQVVPIPPRSVHMRAPVGSQAQTRVNDLPPVATSENQNNIPHRRAPVGR